LLHSLALAARYAYAFLGCHARFMIMHIHSFISYRWPSRATDKINPALKPEVVIDLLV